MNRKTFQLKSLSLPAAAIAVAGLLVVAPLGAQPAEGDGHGPGDHLGAHDHGPGHFGPPGGRGMERLARLLDLTEAQREAARAIHETTRATLAPSHQRSRALHEELRALLDAEAPDALGVGEKVVALDANRDEMRRVHEQARADFEALLTPEQLAELEELEERRGDRRHGRHGRHGAGHFGHFGHHGTPASPPAQ